jgi:uncharacterized protein YfdQ (DUF2303 family)
MDDSTLHSQGAGTAAVIETAQEAVAPHILDSDHLYGVRDSSGALVPLDLERFREWPDRPKGTYRPATVEAFIDYVEKHADEEKTTVWVHPTEGKIQAILDDNAPSGSAWRDHRALLELIVTPEWRFWLEHDGKLLSQQEFAEKIEDGVREIIKPDAAEMLEIAQSIQATTDVAFRSKIEIHSGEVQVAYDEKTQATAGKAGQLTVPQTFDLAISPFVGEDPYKITARLRYRAEGGTLRIGYRLDQPERAVRDVLEGIAETVGKKFDRVYMGTPAS